MAAKLLLLASSLLAVPTATVSSDSYETGPFTVHYDTAQAPTLRITATVDGRRDTVVWYTSASNRTFITAARVEQTVKQNGGTFIFTTSVQEVCSDMNITRNGVRAARDTNAYNQVKVPLRKCRKDAFNKPIF